MIIGIIPDFIFLPSRICWQLFCQSIRNCFASAVRYCLLPQRKIYIDKKGHLFRQPFLCFTLCFLIYPEIQSIVRYQDINLAAPSGVGLFGGFCAEVHVKNLLSESDALGCYFQ